MQSLLGQSNFRGFCCITIFVILGWEVANIIHRSFTTIFPSFLNTRGCSTGPVIILLLSGGNHTDTTFRGCLPSCFCSWGRTRNKILVNPFADKTPSLFCILLLLTLPWLSCLFPLLCAFTKLSSQPIVCPFLSLLYQKGWGEGSGLFGVFSCWC